MKCSARQKTAILITAFIAAAAVSFCGGLFCSSVLASGRHTGYSISGSEAQASVPAGMSAHLQEETPSDAAIDINTADSEALQSLSGIGETLAERIIAYRKENGPFEHTFDIMNVSGIGSGIYEKIKDEIYVRDR